MSSRFEILNFLYLHILLLLDSIFGIFLSLEKFYVICSRIFETYNTRIDQKVKDSLFRYFYLLFKHTHILDTVC